MPALAHGTRSLALFSSAAGATVAAVPLPSTVESMAVIDRLPRSLRRLDQPVVTVVTQIDHVPPAALGTDENIN
jgi:hypothetical protein